MIKAESTLEIECPFCNGTVYDYRGQQDVGLVHTLPMCQRFRDLEPIEFLRACNEALERRCGHGNDAPFCTVRCACGHSCANHVHDVSRRPCAYIQDGAPCGCRRFARASAN